MAELALDLLDEDAKASTVEVFDIATASTPATTAAAAASPAPRHPTRRCVQGSSATTTSSVKKKGALLGRRTYHVLMQRADGYNAELMKRLQINSKGYDTLLSVLCSSFFRKKLNKPTTIAFSDPIVQHMAAER
ncbi:hypothetical protein LdCL_130019800 [Leishmania donovani]|uniref:Uncharacterized protein n=1 Tax=Leishmania donovani TaxID=5661 RepID=A0A3Q8IBU3_LEIDO|nr:hypothetical protein LdCL_130019800 [Leishmania donovani]